MPAEKTTETVRPVRVSATFCLYILVAALLRYCSKVKLKDRQSQFPQVTHSYLRKDCFNIWFTIIVVDNESD